jgi:hypothetical protein
MASRKDFVLEVVQQLQENPRAVLAGHGILPAVLQTITARPDVMSKLATVLYSTVNAKKGAAGLKKAPNFRIFGYKSSGQLIDQGREDVESFVAGLSAEDVAKFNNSNNILVIVLQPQPAASGDEEVTEEIVSGKSVCLTFDQAISKAFKFPGAMYLAIMMGDSVARPQEEAVAERKEKVNKAKQKKRTPAKVASELKAKAAKKLAILKAKRSNLTDEAYNTSLELNQYSSLGEEFGAGSDATGKGIFNAMSKFDKGVNAKKAILDEINLLSPEDKELLNQAIAYKKAGKENLAKAMLKEINNPTITAFVLKASGSMQQLSSLATSDEIIANRKKEYKSALRRLVIKNEQLLVDLALAPKEKQLSIRSMISKNNRAISDLRTKLGTYKNLSVEAMNNKAKMLKEVHAAIEENIASGENINAALTNALAALDAKAAQKEIIKQQVMEQVANGKPMQYAVQQAIQEMPEEELEDSALSDDFEMQDLLNSL